MGALTNETAIEANAEPTVEIINVVHEIVINPIQQSNEPQTNTAVSSGTEQTIQSDIAPKPNPCDERLSDPTQSPCGTETELPVPETLTDPTVKPHDTQTPANASQPTTNSNQPQSDATRDGQIYIPGFGWIDNHGGGGHGQPADSDGDIDKMVGDMG
jgi:hypothetical protein